MTTEKSAFIVGKDGKWNFDFNEPKLTVLNFSGGKQSSALLWMVIRGDIPMPENFVVMNADPGMENSKTYEYVAYMKQLCDSNSIRFITAPGPNLLEDILNLKGSGKTRLDNPSYYTKSVSGKKGKLKQCCTKAYKIAPMDRQIRKILKQAKLGLKPLSVHKWIGFSKSEVSRIKPPDSAYTAFRYPLVELGLTNADVEQYFHKNDLPIPPRSVCNACFANSVQYMREMSINRPKEFAQVVAVDESIRDWGQIGVTDQVYILSTLIPVKDAVKLSTENSDSDEDTCTSGYCFI